MPFFCSYFFRSFSDNKENQYGMFNGFYAIPPATTVPYMMPLGQAKHEILLLILQPVTPGLSCHVLSSTTAPPHYKTNLPTLVLLRILCKGRMHVYLFEGLNQFSWGSSRHPVSLFALCLIYLWTFSSFFFMDPVSSSPSVNKWQPVVLLKTMPMFSQFNSNLMYDFHFGWCFVLGFLMCLQPTRQPFYLLYLYGMNIY